MKIFNISQTKELDELTLRKELISPEILMERAASCFTKRITRELSPDMNIVVLAGPGNNGGDAKLVASLLRKEKYRVTLFENWNENSIFPKIKESDVIIDGLFGAGINRPLTGIYAGLVQHLNKSKARIYSIDIPSGLFGEDNSGNDPDTIIKAYKTLTFQYPKLAFFFAENEVYTGRWEIIDIGLHTEGIAQTEAAYHYTEEKDIQALLKKRHKFDHKGNFGHALIVAGSRGKFGAAILAAKACLRSGAGLVTAHIPANAELIMQTAVPEVMISLDRNREYITGVNLQSSYSTVGIGPGISRARETENLIYDLLPNSRGIVLDADALNIISERKNLINRISKHSILTPHPKEFDRLTSSSSTSFERLQKARELAARLKSYIVLKGAYTAICTPEKNVYFNSTGNPGMATAGSGDVLTGIITGLLAQSYTPEEAAKIGVFVHGLAGDLAAKKRSEESMIAGDIIEFLGKAFKKLKIGK